MTVTSCIPLWPSGALEMTEDRINVESDKFHGCADSATVMCMTRSPDYVIEAIFERADVKLPNTVSQFGSTPEEIFICYEQVKNMIGANEIKNIPLGAIGIYSYSDKIKVGLQQLMAGARCFSVPTISRRELMSLTEECAKVTGIPYLMEAYREEAMAIITA